MESIKQVIKARRSVRTYDGKQITAEDRRKLIELFNDSGNPFGAEVEFRLLNAEEHDLTSPVIVGADLYVGAKLKTGKGYEVACGYSFERFCLSAWAIGIGTVMLGGTLSRKTFEKAMELKEDEAMPVASPVGYPAQKLSVREKMMRGAVKADKRLPFEKLFFENSFDTGLTEERAGKFADALEAVRLAPSAINKQPWRAVVCGDTVHFFEKKSAGMATEKYDIQKVDMGIALAHFNLTLEEQGVTGRFFDGKPDFAVADGLEYIISYKA